MFQGMVLKIYFNIIKCIIGDGFSYMRIVLQVGVEYNIGINSEFKYLLIMNERINYRMYV